jgi:hypothetical protein
MTDVKVNEETRQKVTLKSKDVNEKLTNLKTCWVHTIEETGAYGGKKQTTIATSAETGTANDCNLFENIWGMHLSEVKLVKKSLTFKGVAIKAPNTLFTQTLCSPRMSIFPTDEGFRIKYTDKDEFIYLYPAVKNFPTGENFFGLDHAELGMKVAVSVSGTGLEAHVNGQKQDIKLRAENCGIETAKMNMLVEFSSTLPDKQCTSLAEVKYRGLITRELKDPANKNKQQKVMSVIGANLGTLKLKVGNELVALREVNGKHHLLNQIAGASKCGAQPPKISS